MTTATFAPPNPAVANLFGNPQLQQLQQLQQQLQQLQPYGSMFGDPQGGQLPFGPQIPGLQQHQQLYPQQQIQQALVQQAIAQAQVQQQIQQLIAQAQIQQALAQQAAYRQPLSPYSLNGWN